MITYEQQLDRDRWWALKEGSMHFEKESAVFRSMQKIARRLAELQLPYALAGGMAMFLHGYRRFTEDVDLLVTRETLRTIHEKLEGADGHATNKMTVTFNSVIFQILMLDIVFSLDSVITAVGMVKQIGVMIAAVIIAMVVMLVFVNKISAFVDRHPTIKMLALSFLILIGTMLVAEGFHQHVNKGYIYFAMAFALGVEILNIRLRTKAPKVELHQPYR